MAKTDAWHLGLGLIAALVVAVALFCVRLFCLTVILVALADLYLVTVLIEVALRSGKRGSRTKDSIMLELPERTWSLPQLIFLFWIATAGFARIYIETDGIAHVSHDAVSVTASASGNQRYATLDSGTVVVSQPFDALYFSAVTLMTLGYGDYVPVKPRARMVVVFQLFSGLLLLLGAIPLVVSRLAAFGEAGDRAKMPEAARSIDIGQTLAEVDAALGKATPASTQDDVVTYVYPAIRVTVTLIKGKVSAFGWE